MSNQSGQITHLSALVCVNELSFSGCQIYQDERRLEIPPILISFLAKPLLIKPMVDTGNTFAAARLINLRGTDPAIFRRRELIGGIVNRRRDTNDYYRFRLASSSDVSLTLSNLRNRQGRTSANFTLFDQQRQRIASSRLPNPGARRREIETQLGEGTYYIRVFRGFDRTRYQLSLTATPTEEPPPPQTAPQIQTSAGAVVGKGASRTIGRDLLEAIDREQSPAELTYTLDAAPQNGTLRLNGNALNEGGTFTQADIDSGRLSYQSISSTNQPIGTGVNPQISGSTVVWSGPDSTGGTDSEIYVYDPAYGIIQLTNNSFDDTNPKISGDNIVWVGAEGNDTEIFYGNATTRNIRRLTNDDFNDFDPQIAGSNVAWVKNDGTDNEIYIIRNVNNAAAEPIQVTDNNTNDSNPQLSRFNLAWYHQTDNNQQEIWFYRVIGSSEFVADRDVARLVGRPNRTTGASSLQVSDAAVVWVQPIGGRNQINYFSGSGQITIPRQDNTDKGSPQLSSDGNVAWVNLLGGNNEIFYAPRGAVDSDPNTSGIITQVTSNAQNDASPQISGRTVAWQRFDGTDYEIFYFEDKPGTETFPPTALTDNITNDTLLGVSSSIVFYSSVDPTTLTTELFYFNTQQGLVGANRSTQLTFDDGIDNYLLRTSGANVVWSNQSALASGGSSGSAIFYRNLATTDSFSFTVDDGTPTDNVSASFNITIDFS
jgi:hypothetical protein